MSNVVMGIVSIHTIVDLIPRTIGNVRLPTARSPFKSQISPRGPKIKKKAILIRNNTVVAHFIK